MTYEERKAARIDRLRNAAARAERDSMALYQESRHMADVIPLGQPILIGHYSEKSDRAYRNRIWNKMDKSVELNAKAKELERRADAAEKNTAISSDDPNAPEKLWEKIGEAEALREEMKKVNTAWRKAGKPAADDPEGWNPVAVATGYSHERLARLRLRIAHHHWDPAPYPTWELSNLGANIKRMKARLEDLEAVAGAEYAERDERVCKVIEDPEENRIRLVFDGKPPAEVRKLLKCNGFRFSRYNLAWQRHLNNAGRHAAEYVVNALTQKEE